MGLISFSAAAAAAGAAAGGLEGTGAAAAGGVAVAEGGLVENHVTAKVAAGWIGCE